MKRELYINGKDAYTTWGVSMGDNFLDTLEAPLTVKDYISNESRTEDGKRVITDKSMIKIAARDVTLQFHICGKNQREYLQNKKDFQQELYGGVIDINIPARGPELYHLLYLGKQVSYSQSYSEGKLSAKFEEPNPTNRE